MIEKKINLTTDYDVTHWQLLQFSSLPSLDFSSASTTISSPFPLLNVSRGKSSIDDDGDVGREASTSTVEDGETIASMLMRKLCWSVQVVFSSSSSCEIGN